MMPSRICVQPGLEYSSYAVVLPSPGCTVRILIWPYTARTASTRVSSLVRERTTSSTDSSDRICGATRATAARQLKSVLSSLSTHSPAKLAEPSGANTPSCTGLGTTTRSYANGFTLTDLSRSSGSRSDVTTRDPPGTTSLLIG